MSLSVPGAEDCHLLFVFSHISSKKSKTSIFGFSFLTVRDQTFKRRSQFSSLGGSSSSLILDGVHNLRTYAPVTGLNSLGIPNAKGKVIRPLSTYLNVSGSTKPVLRRDTFRVKTFLISNVTPRDKNLRDLMRLNLKNFHGKTTNTSELIDRVGLMDENELVKILDNVTFIDQVTVAVYVREIFDRLFVLLGQLESGVPLQQDVFCVLVQCIGRMTGSRSNCKHREALDIYINEMFDTNNENLFQVIVDQATELMQWLDDYEGNKPTALTETKCRRTISSMMRCFEYVVRFAMRAGMKAHTMAQRRDASGAAATQMELKFKHALQQLMYYADALMRKNTPKWIKLVQEHTIANVIPVFEHLQAVFNQPELGEIVRGFIESIPHDSNERASLRMKKLSLMHDLMSSTCEIYVHNSSRKSCIAATVRILQAFLNSDFMNERRLAVLTLRHLVQMIHDAKSSDDAWNLSCMLPDIAECTALLLQVREKRGGHSRYRSIAENPSILNNRHQPAASAAGGVSTSSTMSIIRHKDGAPMLKTKKSLLGRLAAHTHANNDSNVRHSIEEVEHEESSEGHPALRNQESDVVQFAVVRCVHFFFFLYIIANSMFFFLVI